MAKSSETKQLPIRYQCPVCLEGYDSMAQAVACRDHSDRPVGWAGWQPGDLCLIPGKGYYHEPGEMLRHTESPWLAFVEPAQPDSSDHFDHKDRWHYFWVVTALERHESERHRLIVYVATKVNGEVHCGWNPADGEGHYQLFRPGTIKAPATSDHHTDYYWDRLNTRFTAATPSDDLLRQSKKLIGNVSGWLL